MYGQLADVALISPVAPAETPRRQLGLFSSRHKQK